MGGERESTAAEKKEKGRQRCPRCGGRKVKNGWKYCRACGPRVRREMAVSGYLTPVEGRQRGLPPLIDGEVRCDGTVHGEML